MEPATAEELALRVGEHADKYSQSRMDITFAGDDPLQAGREFFGTAVSALYDRLPRTAELQLSVQTPAASLRRTMMEFFLRNHIQVDAAVDAIPQPVSRPTNVSQDATGIQLLQELRYTPVYRRLVYPLSLQDDPVRTYKSFQKIWTPAVDFVLPHGTWESPPPGRTPHNPATPYADWFIPMFDHWINHDMPATTPLLLDNIISGLLGNKTFTEAIGKQQQATVTVGPSGDYRRPAADIQSSGEPASLDMNIFEHPLHTAARHPRIRRRLAQTALSDTCRSCQLVEVCGGGMYAHRYSEARYFSNPSVYCPDLTKLILHIHQTVSAEMQKKERDPQALPNQQITAIKQPAQ